MPRKPKKPAAPASNSPLPEHALVEVTWLDANFDLDRELDCCVLRTLGFLIRHTPEKIVIASEGNLEDRYFRSFTAIPAGMILAVRPLS